VYAIYTVKYLPVAVLSFIYNLSAGTPAAAAMFLGPLRNELVNEMDKHIKR
jgi:hypothetical protein